MNDVTKDLIAAIEAAFREGFRSPTTYNDTVLNSEDDEWEKSDAKAAIARAEGALAEPKPDADGWIPWAGFQIPIQDGVAHQVEFRDGEVSEVDFEASGWSWMHDGDGSDIVRYRIAKESGK